MMDKGKHHGGALPVANKRQKLDSFSGVVVEHEAKSPTRSPASGNVEQRTGLQGTDSSTSYERNSSGHMLSSIVGSSRLRLSLGVLETEPGSASNLDCTTSNCTAVLSSPATPRSSSCGSSPDIDSGLRPSPDDMECSSHSSLQHQTLSCTDASAAVLLEHRNFPQPMSTHPAPLESQPPFVQLPQFVSPHQLAAISAVAAAATAAAAAGVLLPACGWQNEARDLLLRRQCTLQLLGMLTELGPGPCLSAPCNCIPALPCYLGAPLNPTAVNGLGPAQLVGLAWWAESIMYRCASSRAVYADWSSLAQRMTALLQWVIAVGQVGATLPLCSNGSTGSGGGSNGGAAGAGATYPMQQVQ